MTRQNLREREIALALSELSGKLSIHAIRDHLKERGFIIATEDVINAWELDQARKYVQKARKYDNPEGTGKIELVNLFEFDDKGDKRAYYRNVRECSRQEHVQLCTYWHRRGRYAEKRLLHYADVAIEIHGRRFQRSLPFKLPKKPVTAS